MQQSEAKSRKYRTLLNGLQNGGPAGLIYGYIFVWCGASLQALVMAEMASMYVHMKLLMSSRTSLGSFCLGHALLQDLLGLIRLTFGSLGRGSIGAQYWLRLASLEQHSCKASSLI